VSLAAAASAKGAAARRSDPPSFWAQVRALARPYRRHLALVAVFVTAAALAGVVPPLVIRHIIDRNLLPRRSAGLLGAGLVYLTAVVGVAAFAYAYGYVAAVVAQKAIASLRIRLFAHVTRLPVSYLDRTPVGEVISRATADVETIDTLFTDGVVTLVGQLVSLAATAIAMVAVSPVLSGVSLVVVPPLVAVSRWLQIRVRDAERQTRVAIGGLNAQLSETVGGAETIRAFGRETSFVARFRGTLLETLAAQESSVRYNAFFTPVTSLLSALVIGALLWVGAGGLLRSFGFDLGTIVAFILLFQGFFAPIVALGDRWNSVQAAIAGAERVFEVLNLPAEQPPQAQPETGSRGIVVSDVSFAYQPGRTVLRNVSFVVRPGERVAVVGRTGAGKSTLLALLGGLYRPNSGEIFVSGRDPRGLTEAQRRRVLGVVPQEVQLLSGSIRENLVMGDSSIGEDAIDRVVPLVGLDRILAGMPDGLDTVVADPGGGSGGVVLSAGQRQLVALARAVIAEPEVLLLDEATAAVDPGSDAAFRAALVRTAWARNCAVVTVAHRISTARDSDRVVVLDAGRIVEQGIPAELIAAGGLFAALAAMDEAGWDWSRAAGGDGGGGGHSDESACSSPEQQHQRQPTGTKRGHE
jgi:ATP-binding cassette subfamily B multidrug efflux pump